MKQFFKCLSVTIMAAYQIEDASKILVWFARNLSGGSASSIQDKIPPPKQWSIAVNQLDRGFFHAIATAPEMEKKQLGLRLLCVY
jgi:hypothetical protein